MKADSQNIDDAAIIDRIVQNRDRDAAYRILVDRHKDFAFTLAFRVLNNREEAEEAAQDAFVRAFKALPSFQNQSKFTTWFYRIVMNAALSQKEKKKIPVDELDEARTVAGELSADQTKARDQKYFIQKALQQLLPDDVLFITLFYLKELSMEEIAETTGVETNTVKVKVHRARKRLAEALQNMLKGEEKNLF